MVIVEDMSLEGEVNEDITIKEQARLQIRSGAIVNGNVEVLDGSFLESHGTINGNIFVSLESRAELHGEVFADKIECIGETYIYGNVECKTEPEGNIKYHMGSVVNGVYHKDID